MKKICTPLVTLIAMVCMLLGSQQARAVCNISVTDSIVATSCSGNTGQLFIYPSGGTMPYFVKKGINGTWSMTTSYYLYVSLPAEVDTIYVTDTTHVCTQSIIATIPVATVTPAVTLTNLTTGSVCKDSNTLIKMTATNAGINAFYYVYRNGLVWSSGNFSLPADTLSVSAYGPNDSVWVRLTSNASCPSPGTVNSNTVFIHAYPAPSAPVMTRSGSGCVGDTLTAGVPTNVNSITWYRNGVSFTTPALTRKYIPANYGSYTVTYVDPNGCTSPLAVPVSIDTPVRPSVALYNAPQGTICYGIADTFVAIGRNTGSSCTYKWYVSGVLKQTDVTAGTSATYLANGLTSTDSVWVELYSTAPCASPVPAVSNRIRITVLPAPPAPVLTAYGTTCNTDSLYISAPTNATAIYWYRNNSLISTPPLTYTYRPTQSGNYNAVYTDANGCTPIPTNTVVVNTAPQPSVSMTLSISACTDTFRATPTNGGTAPSYQWFKNNQLISGATGATYIVTGLLATDTIKVKMTSSLSCVTPPFAFSFPLTANNAAVTPVVYITPVLSAVCGATRDSFYLYYANNGGTAPTFVWYKNGTAVQTGTAGSYAGTVSPGDSIWVTMISNAPCASPTSATSNRIRINNAAVVPSVSITASTTVVCGAVADTFYATGINGGSAPTFYWYKNGTLSQAGSTPYYITSSLVGGDSVWVVMNSTAACATPASPTSNHIRITTGTAVPSVSVSGNTSVCAGNAVSYTATPTNGGTAPTYIWYKNGVQVGTGSTYTTTSYASGDSFWVVMTSSLACVSPTTATSAHIRLTVNTAATAPLTSNSPVTAGDTLKLYSTNTYSTYSWTGPNGFTATTKTPVLPNVTTAMAGTYTMHGSNTTSCGANGSITVVVNPGPACNMTLTDSVTNPICPGGLGSVKVFAANGTAPYKYKLGVNGQWQYSNIFNNLIANVADTFYVRDTTGCQRSITATIIQPTGQIVPVISIAVNTTVACSGVIDTFRASYINGGSNPVFNWYKNGTIVQGGGSPIFITSSLVNGDSVWVSMTSSITCANPLVVTSAHIRMSGTATPYVYITASTTTICGAAVDTFRATSVNGGTSPTYQWFKNGQQVQNTPLSTYITTSLVNGDSVWVVMTSNSPCASPTTATSNHIRITVSTSVAPSVSITATRTSFCGGYYGLDTFRAAVTNGGTAPTYQWYRNTTAITGATSATYIANNNLVGGDSIWVRIVSSLSCASPTVAYSNRIIIVVSSPSTITLSSNSPVTAGGTLQLTSSTAGVTWTGPNGFTSTTQNPTIPNVTTAASGTYIAVGGTNSLGCGANGSINVVVNPNTGCNITLTDSVFNPLCYYSNTGQIKVYATGGTAPYRYKKGINGGWQYNNVFSGLPFGTDTIYVTDTTSCTKSIVATLYNPPAINIGYQITNATSGNNGSLVGYAYGGSGSFTYTWSNGATTASIYNLAAGQYCVTVRDTRGCSSTMCATIISTSLPPLTFYMDTVVSSTGQTATVHVRVRNFRKLVSAQTTIKFNPLVATYSSVSNFGISSLNAGNFGTTGIANGLLTLSWSDATLAGVSLADGTILFNINYTIVGVNGQYTAVSMVDSPLVREFADTSLRAVAYLSYPGRINVVNSVSISGRVYNWAANNGIRKTIVAVSGGANQSVTTDTSGSYSFSVVQGTVDTITPSKNNDSIRANGVTTLDVLQVQRYLLGTFALTGPYRLIAADVNSSGSISTLDYTLMQSLILGNTTTFPGNKLWNFVPSNYTFVNPQAPWGFPTQRFYPSASTQVSQTGQDFIGIKLGDVSGDWNPTIARQQAADSVTLYMPELSASHTATDVAVPVKCRNFNGISGFQFSIRWDSTVLAFASLDTTHGAVRVGYGATQAASGMLSIAWTDPNFASTYVADDSTLFFVHFRAIGAAGDSSYVRLDSVPTAVQIIDSNLSIATAGLVQGIVRLTTNVGISEVSREISIAVHPNPATSEVLIETGAAGADIHITDVSGRLVYDRTGADRREQVSTQGWAAGIYTVSVRYADRSRSVKLIVLH